MKQLKYSLGLPFYLLKAFFRGVLSKDRFIRLNAHRVGRIKFYDKKARKIFTFWSRNGTDSITLNQIFVREEYNFSHLTRVREIRERYEKLVSNGMTPLIIDCGANIGASSYYFAEEFPHAQVVGIEPDKGNFDSAQRNCSGLPNVELREAAISSATGHVRITNEHEAPNAFQVESHDGESGIPAITIPALMASYPHSELLIVKVDIEGFEADLFKDNTDWIDCAYLLIVELHDWMLPKTASSRTTLRALSERNRDFILHGENIVSIKNV